MTKQSSQNDPEPVELAIPLEKVCFIIMKAREFDVKDVSTIPDRGSNPADDDDAAVLEDQGDDPVLEEITSLVSEISVDEQVDLVALMWLGRGDYTAADWPSVRAEAISGHNEHTAEYLSGTPLLADYLAEGLSLLGLSCADYE